MHYKRAVSMLLVLVMLFSVLLPASEMQVSGSEEAAVPLTLEEYSPGNSIALGGVQGEFALTFNQAVTLREGTQIQLLYDKEKDGNPDDPVLISGKDGMGGENGEYRDILSVDGQNGAKVTLNLSYGGIPLLEEDHIYRLNVYPVVSTSDGGEVFPGLGISEGRQVWTFDTLVSPSASTIRISGKDTLENFTEEVFTAEVLNAYGHTMPESGVLWESSDPSVASVDEGGKVSAVGPGTVVISAVSGMDAGVRAEKSLTVSTVALVMMEKNASPVTSAGLDGEISLTFNQPVEIIPTDKYFYQVALYEDVDGDGTGDISPIEGQVPYLTGVLSVSPDNPNKVLVHINQYLAKDKKYILAINVPRAMDACIRVKGSTELSGDQVFSGIGQVSQKTGWFFSTIPVTGQPHHITIEGNTVLAVGASCSLSALVEDVEGNEIEDSLIWSVSDGEIASVDGNGTVTGISSGTVTVTARSAKSGLEGTYTLDVEQEEDYEVNILHKITHIETEGNSISGIKVQNGVVYAISGSHIKVDGIVDLTRYRSKFYAYDLSGNKLWEVSFGEKVSMMGIPSVAEDGSSYVQCKSVEGKETFLYAINPDGSLKWGEPAVAEGVNTDGDGPKFYDGKVLFYTKTDVYAVDARTGKQLWSYGTQENINNTMLAGENLLVRVGSREIWALSAEDGNEKWSVKSDRRIGMPAEGEDGTLYIADSSGMVYAYDGNTGRQKTEDPRDGLQAAVKYEYSGGLDDLKIGKGNVLYLCYTVVDTLGKSKSYLKAINPNGSTRYIYEKKGSGIESIDEEGYVYYVESGGLASGYAIVAVSPQGTLAGTIAPYGSTGSYYFNLSIEGNTLVGGRYKNGEFIIATISRGTLEGAASLELSGSRQIGLYKKESVGAVVRNAKGEAISGTKLEWASSDPSVIEVMNEDGKVYFMGHKQGTAVLTATVAGTGISASASYTVVEAAPFPSSVRFYDAQGKQAEGGGTVPYGESYTYTYMVYDQYGNPMPEEWLINKEKASDMVGGSITRTYKEDETEVYWIINNPAVSGFFSVTVQKEEETFSSLHPGYVPLNPGGELELATLDQYGGTYALSGAVWKSSDEGVAAVDGAGKVTALAPGSTVITATALGKTINCTVEVVDTFGYTWQTEAEVSAGEILMTMDSQGRIYSVIKNSGIYYLKCTDAQGNLLWESSSLQGSPKYLAAWGDKVYCQFFSTKNFKKIVCMDSSGKEEWTRTWEDASAEFIKNLLWDGAGNLYTADTKALYCLNSSGGQQWELALGETVQNYAFDQEGNILVVGTEDGSAHLYTIKNDGQEGRVVDSHTLPLELIEGSLEEMVIDEENTLYIPYKEGVVAIRDGKVLWQYKYEVEDGLSSYTTYNKVANSFNSLRLELVGQTLYAVTKTTDGNYISSNGESLGIKLYMLDARTGGCLKELALNEMAEIGYSMPSVGDFVVDEDGTAYFPLTLKKGRTYKGSLILAIDREGKVVKRISYPDNRFPSMAHILLGEDSLYVLAYETLSSGSSSNGYLVKFPFANTEQAVPDSVIINASRTSVVQGNSLNLSASVYSQFGGVMKGESVSWGSSDKRIAMVDADGKVTGISPGTAVIYVSSVSNSAVRANLTLTVQEAGKYFLVWDEIQDKADLTIDFYKRTGVSGDWIAFALWAMGEDINDPVYYYGGKSYISQTWNLVSAAKGKFSVMTDYERMCMGIMASGYDPSNFAGYNLIESIYNYPSLSQGNNAVMWGLIALNMADADIPEDAKWDQEYLINFLLTHKVKKAWNYAGDSPDTDMTAMAIYALAPYYNEREDVKKSVDEAVEWLKSVQNENGSFNCFGGTYTNTESTAQVIIALCSIGIDPQSEDFTRSGGNPVTAMLGNQLADGQFEHIAGIGEDGLATNQSLQALGALKQFYEKGISTIFSEITYYRDNPVEEWMELIEDINFLPEDGASITLSDEARINALRARYEALSSVDREQVSNLDRLLQAERRISVLKDKTPPVISTDLISKTVAQRKLTFKVSLTDEVSGELTPQVLVNSTEVKGIGGLYTVSLNMGENLIRILGTDENGNKTEQSYWITYKPEVSGGLEGLQGGSQEGVRTSSDSGRHNGGTKEVSAEQEEVIRKIREAVDGEVLTLQASEKFMLNGEILTALKEKKNLKVVVNREGYSLSFDTSQITGKMTGNQTMDFNMAFTSTNEQSIRKAFGGGEILLMHFNYHGELPFPLTIKVSLTDGLKEKTFLYLYYYNQDTGRLEQLDTLVLIEDGYAQFTITHCSDYVLSDTSLRIEEDTEDVKTAEASLISGEETKKLPVPAIAAAIIIAVSAMGAGIAYKRKRAGK